MARDAPSAVVSAICKLWLGTALVLWGALVGGFYTDAEGSATFIGAGLILLFHLLHWHNAVRTFLAGEKPLNEWLSERPNLSLSALTLGVLMVALAVASMVSLASVPINHIMNASIHWRPVPIEPVIMRYLVYCVLTFLLGLVGFLTARWGWNQERQYLQALRERAILETAQAQGGIVSVSEVALATGLSLAESKELLEELCAKRLIERVPQAEGPMLYRVFPFST